MNIELVTRQLGAKRATETRDHPDLCPVPHVAHLLQTEDGGALLLIGYSLSNYSSKVG